MTEIITSVNNPTIKMLRKLLSSSRARREANLFVAEGIHLVQSFLLSGQLPNLFIYAESAINNQEIAQLLQASRMTNAEKVVIADSLFESFTNIHASSGICITFTPRTVALKTILPLTVDCILLEDIQDPGNVGTILRTAAAVGIKNVLLSDKCASPWSPKSLRAGMGAQFSLDIYENIDLLNVLNGAQITSLATVLSKDSASLYDIDLKKQIAWLFGSEGQGISEKLSRAAKIKATIPQEATTVESLNVAAAAAVCLYEQYRQKNF